MNQFENQCRRILKGLQCQNKHIFGHYWCENCIAEVEEIKANRKLRCNREIKTEEGKTRCKNERVKGQTRCSQCILEAENRRRYYTHRINKDLIIDIRR